MFVITKSFLRNNPSFVFVFGDNIIRKGYGGAAALRDEWNSFGFITKRYPDNDDASFYKPVEYEPIFQRELARLVKQIKHSPDKVFLISQLGSGLANKYKIWEDVIERGLQPLIAYPNVKFLFKYKYKNNTWLNALGDI